MFTCSLGTFSFKNLKIKICNYCIIMFSGLDDHGLLLRNLLGILPPSVCGIFRSGPSSTLQHSSREEGWGGEGI